MLTLCEGADSNAPRRFSRAAVPPLKVCSDAPTLWLMTCASPLSITNCSAFIIWGKPWTPSVSAVGVVTSRTLALGATACTHSTSRETSTSQTVRASLPGSWAVGGGALVSVQAWTQRMSNVGSPGLQAWLSSPHMCGRPNWVSKLLRSARMVLLPNESTTATVMPWPWLPAAYRALRLYAFSCAAGAKQRRPAATHAASDGGWRAVPTCWKSIATGRGTAVTADEAGDPPQSPSVSS